MPTYRFTQTAFYEIDIKAETMEDAEKLAEEDWYEAFDKGLGIFGSPEFEEIVKEEAK